MKKLQLNPPTEKKNCLMVNIKWNVFLSNRPTFEWLEKTARKTVGDESDELWKTNGGFVLFLSYCVVFEYGRHSSPMHGHQFPQANEQASLTNRRGGLFFIVNFFALSLFMLCYSNCHFTFVLICSLDLFWPRVCVYVCLSKCLVHRPVFLFIVFFLLLTHSSLT